MAIPATAIKILLADSDEPMRSLLQEYLKRLGYDVFAAQNGREAIDIARGKKPDLIILERALPELDGLEVCRLLKNDALTHDILFIFLSAKDDIDSKISALSAGANDYIVKPFSPRELEARISATLRNKQLKPAELTPAKSKRNLKIFLCHSSGDKNAVRALYRQLESAADYIAPWLDEEELLPGQSWEDEIPAAVRNSDVVLVCLSNESINKSGYVQKEIKDAIDVADRQPDGTIFLIPVKLEECQMPNRLSHLHYVNLFEDRGFERLVRALVFRAEKLDINDAQRDTVEIIKYEAKGFNVNLPEIYRRLRDYFT